VKKFDPRFKVRVRDCRSELPTASVTVNGSQRETGRGAPRESEEPYRLLLDGLQNYAKFQMDAQGLILSWNAGASDKVHIPSDYRVTTFPALFCRKYQRGRRLE